LNKLQRTFTNAEEAALRNEVAFKNAFQECFNKACQDNQKDQRTNKYDITYMRTEIPNLKKLRALITLLNLGSEDTVDLGPDDYYWQVIQPLPDPIEINLTVKYDC